MRIHRFFTGPDTQHSRGSSRGESFGLYEGGPYDRVAFRQHSVGKADDYEVDGADHRFTAPCAWPASVTAAFAHHAALADGAPVARRRVREAKVPQALRRYRPMADIDGHFDTTAETDIRSTLDRVAGALARAGWDAGYFSSETDALVFHDELRACLLQRRATFSADLWQTVGLGWAYGRVGTPPAPADLPDGSAACHGFAYREDAAALAMGRAMMNTIRSQIAAALNSDCSAKSPLSENTALHEALEAAQRMGLPATGAQRLLDAAMAGIPADDDRDTHLDADSDIWTALAPTDVISQSLSTRDGEALAAQTAASYMGDAGPVIFDANAHVSMCAHNGRTDPTATLDLSAFVAAGSESGIDIDALVNTVRLLTIALDLTYEEQSKADEQRSLALTVTNAAPLVMSFGLAYGSDEGRAMVASLCALVTATSLATSAELAGQISPFPAFGASADKAWRFARNMERALLGQSTGYHGLAHTPQPLYPLTTQQAYILDAARTLFGRAKAKMKSHGLRNLGLTGVAADTTAARLLGTQGDGIAPMRTLVRYQRLTPEFDGSAIYKTVSPAVPAALRALHHDDNTIDRLIDHIVGHGSLVGAPGVNHDLLRERGFTDEDIEATEHALATAGNVRAAFTPYVLGWDHILEDDDDILARLGFSEWDVEHANYYCCGALTLEGARDLPLEQLPVFDCAQPLGQIGTRCVSARDRLHMAHAVQPFVTNGLSLDLQVPQDTAMADFAALYQDAEEFGLTSICINRDGTDPTEALTYDDIMESVELYIDDVEVPNAPPSQTSSPTTAIGINDEVAAAICVGLHHGVPLEAYADVLDPVTQAEAMRTIAATYLASASQALRDAENANDAGLLPPDTMRTARLQTLRPSPPIRQGVARIAARPSPASGSPALAPPSVTGRHREE
ncbi:hypothetical protein [Pyruvatibacter sp.]|uniref:hypothetical protein n=1 Tax=Pyruvatibacter sp. TaxID=1981328 RepID=UPI0032EE3290